MSCDLASFYFPSVPGFYHVVDLCMHPFLLLRALCPPGVLWLMRPHHPDLSLGVRLPLTTCASRAPMPPSHPLHCPENYQESTGPHPSGKVSLQKQGQPVWLMTAPPVPGKMPGTQLVLSKSLLSEQLNPSIRRYPRARNGSELTCEPEKGRTETRSQIRGERESSTGYSSHWLSMGNLCVRHDR